MFEKRKKTLYKACQKFARARERILWRSYKTLRRRRRRRREFKVDFPLGENLSSNCGVTSPRVSTRRFLSDKRIIKSSLSFLFFLPSNYFNSSHGNLIPVEHPCKKCNVIYIHSRRAQKKRKKKKRKLFRRERSKTKQKFSVAFGVAGAES